MDFSGRLELQRETGEKRRSKPLCHSLAPLLNFAPRHDNACVHWSLPELINAKREQSWNKCYRIPSHSLLIGMPPLSAGLHSTFVLRYKGRYRFLDDLFFTPWPGTLQKHGERLQETLEDQATSARTRQPISWCFIVRKYRLLLLKRQLKYTVWGSGSPCSLNLIKGD